MPERATRQKAMWSDRCEEKRKTRRPAKVGGRYEADGEEEAKRDSSSLRSSE